MTKEIRADGVLADIGVDKLILNLRGKQVLLDKSLAELYDVETKVLNQAVKRNMERFPEDFCFQLSEDEFRKWKSQFATSIGDRMGLRKIPYAFTEQGVAMLSSVLNLLRRVVQNAKVTLISDQYGRTHLTESMIADYFLGDGQAC